MECLLKMRCRKNSGPHFFVLKCCEEQFAQNRALLAGLLEKRERRRKIAWEKVEKGEQKEAAHAQPLFALIGQHR